MHAVGLKEGANLFKKTAKVHTKRLRWKSTTLWVILILIVTLIILAVILGKWNM